MAKTCDDKVYTVNQPEEDEEEVGPVKPGRPESDIISTVTSSY